MSRMLPSCGASCHDSDAIIFAWHDRFARRAAAGAPLLAAARPLVIVTRRLGHSAPLAAGCSLRHLECDADRQHDLVADPSPNRRTLGHCSGPGVATGGRDDCGGAIAFLPVLVRLRPTLSLGRTARRIAHDVGRWYLNGAFVCLARVPSLSADGAPRARFCCRRKGGRLLAGLGLAVLRATISLVAVDWFLSLEPHYVASAFAAMIAIQQLAATLAFVAHPGRTPPSMGGGG